MSTTPQRYSEPEETRSYMRRDGLGPWVRFTDHEADKARAVSEARKDLEAQQQNYILLYEAVMGEGSITSELINPEDVARRLRSTIATQQATIARLTKALETIEQWKAFPVITHRGQTSSYAMAYGSNGERDYMRSIARDALYTPPVIN